MDAAFSVNRDVTFELHQRQQNNQINYTAYEVIAATSDNSTLPPSAFDPTKITRIVVHGFRSSRRSFLRYVRAFLKLDDCNVIIVNWLPGSVTYNYYKARNRAKQVNFPLCKVLKI